MNAPVRLGHDGHRERLQTSSNNAAGQVQKHRSKQPLLCLCASRVAEVASGDQTFEEQNEMQLGFCVAAVHSRPCGDGVGGGPRHLL